MNSINITIHPSQFPDQVRGDLAESLRSRRVNHKFHYDSYKQTQKWLALHDAYSPSRKDADCAAAYDKSFAAVVSVIKNRRVYLVGLGCGGGQKDTRLLKLLRDSGREVFYTPCDVSSAMVLVAHRTATQVIPAENCFPLVCDLATTENLADIVGQSVRLPPFGVRGHVRALEHRDMSRCLKAATCRRTPNGAGETPDLLCTFFGMLPNFEPSVILPKLSALILPGDHLLLSANLAPGPDYTAGVEQILPAYDNALTRDWLITFLLDLGVEKEDGELRFVIEDDPGGTGLKRVAAYFDFHRSRTIDFDSERFELHTSDSIRLFFSYRHTPRLVKELLAQYGLSVVQDWVAPSGEEGVFLVRRK